MSDTELKELAREAKDSLDESLRLVHDLLGQLHFDFGKAKLTAVVVDKPRSTSKEASKWIKYVSDDPRTRLDIVYVIESEGNVAFVKLNDVFLVGGKRYLARGYRFQAYRPADTSDESIMELVITHHLDAWVPAIEEKP